MIFFDFNWNVFDFNWKVFDFNCEVLDVNWNCRYSVPALCYPVLSGRPFVTEPR